MPTNILPVVHTVSVSTLRPTQMTVGLREVARKRGDIWAMTAGNYYAATILWPPSSCARPASRGRRAGPPHGDLRSLRLDKNAFLIVLDNRAWMHPFDARQTVRRQHQ
jgi:hypothetical protein